MNWQPVCINCVILVSSSKRDTNKFSISLIGPRDYTSSAVSWSVSQVFVLHDLRTTSDSLPEKFHMASSVYCLIGCSLWSGYSISIMGARVGYSWPVPLRLSWPRGIESVTVHCLSGSMEDSHSLCSLVERPQPIDLLPALIKLELNNVQHPVWSVHHCPWFYIGNVVEYSWYSSPGTGCVLWG